MTSGTALLEPHPTRLRANRPDFSQVHAELYSTFGRGFYLFDARSGQSRFEPGELPSPPPLARLSQNFGSHTAEPAFYVEQLPPVLVLRLRLPYAEDTQLEACGFFVTSRLPQLWIVRRRLGQMGFTRSAACRLARYIYKRAAWSKEALEAAAKLFLDRWGARRQIRQLQDECAALTAELTSTYEEISLLHRLARNLRISQGDEELVNLALEWMEEAVSAQSLAVLIFSPEERAGLHALTDQGPNFYSRGPCPVTVSEFLELTRRLKVADSPRPVVWNTSGTEIGDWVHPQIRQLILAPMRGGRDCFGFFGVFNHREDKEFGTAEANLVASVATILGTHSLNLALYRQQEESLAGTIRALTSAIDAKDAYTCGHSDRVARIAVRLAKELGVEGTSLHMIYLAGLLHDIGKIGTSEAILRKPGKLTEEEYEHIKQHVRVGYRILMDLKHLSGVLPAVLHHHEHWDGSGYPAGLAGEEIPLAARIIAVADAFDAMGSDRPYRRRLPDEKIDAILREGAGKQWDPQVIEAFFRIRPELEAIVLEDRSARTGQEPFPLRGHLVNGAVPAAVLTTSDHSAVALGSI